MKDSYLVFYHTLCYHCAITYLIDFSHPPSWFDQTLMTISSSPPSLPFSSCIIISQVSFYSQLKKKKKIKILDHLKKIVSAGVTAPPPPPPTKADAEIFKGRERSRSGLQPVVYMYVCSLNLLNKVSGQLMHIKITRGGLGAFFAILVPCMRSCPAYMHTHTLLCIHNYTNTWMQSSAFLE